MSGEVKSMAEHWDVLWYLLTAVVGGALLELRLAFHSMRKEQKEFIDLHNQCQKELPEKFVKRVEFDELREDRTKRWEKYFFSHIHYPDTEGGGVKIPRRTEEL